MKKGGTGGSACPGRACEAERTRRFSRVHMWNRRLRLFTGHGGALKFQDQPCPIPRPGPAPVSRNSRSRQLQLPDRFDLRSPDLTVSRANRTPRYVPRRGNRGCQRRGAKGRAGLVESQIQTRHGNGFNPIFLNQVSGFNHADGRYIDRLAVGRGSVERVRSANRQPRVVRKVPKDYMSVRYDRTRSKKCSRGKLPHISLRASAISSSEREIFKSFHSPRMLFSGRFFFVPRNPAKSRTSCCCSGGSSRTAATILRQWSQA